jgi:hypothetical protein
VHERPGVTPKAIASRELTNIPLISPPPLQAMVRASSDAPIDLSTIALPCARESEAESELMSQGDWKGGRDYVHARDDSILNAVSAVTRTAVNEYRRDFAGKSRVIGYGEIHRRPVPEFIFHGGRSRFEFSSCFSSSVLHDS